MCITQAQSHTLHNIPSFLLHQIPHYYTKTRYRMVGVDAGAFLSSPGAWMSRSALFNAFTDALKKLIPGHWIQS